MFEKIQILCHGKQGTLIIIIIVTFAIMEEIVRAFSEKCKLLQFSDSHAFEHGVLFLTTCVDFGSLSLLRNSLSNKTRPSLTVQMQMLSHQLKIAPIINPEKHGNSKSPLRTESIPHYRQHPSHSPLFSLQTEAQKTAGQLSQSFSLLIPLPLL